MNFLYEGNEGGKGTGDGGLENYGIEDSDRQVGGKKNFQGKVIGV